MSPCIREYPFLLVAQSLAVYVLVVAVGKGHAERFWIFLPTVIAGVTANYRHRFFVIPRRGDVVGVFLRMP